MMIGHGQLFFSVVILFLTLFAPGAVNAQSDFDKVKNFISHPPVLSNIVFEVKIFDTEGKIFQNTFHVGLWQRDSFITKEYTNLTAALSSGLNPSFTRIHAQLRTNHWQIVGPSSEITVWNDTGGGERVNVVSIAEKAGLYNFHKMLNLGVPRLPPSSVVWEGDKFISETPDATIDVKGEILSQDGKASKMIVRQERKDKTKSAKWEVEYTYDAQLAIPYLPNLITTYLPRPNGRRKMEELTIHSINASENPLPDEVFSSGPYLQKSPQVFTVAGRGLIHTNKHGEVERIQAFDDGSERAMENTKILYYSLALIFLGITAWFYISSRKQPKATDNTP